MVLVLCYHGVSEAWIDPLTVPLPTLERQLRALLRRGFRPAGAATALAGGGGRLVHVTFDDAFRNVLDALPLLERLGVCATIFACSGYARNGRPLEVPELRKRASGHEPELATMGWETLREVAARGVEIGSHTATHPHLPRLGDQELRRELRGSRDELEERLGRPCRFLAYPFGHHDGRVRAAARAAGYEAAFALGGRRTRERDLFAVPRVGVYRADGPARFALKTSALRPPLGRVASALRPPR